MQGNLRSNRDMNCGTEGWLMPQTEIFGRQLNAHNAAHGLELLKKMTFETHTKCPSCMIGKATLEDFPKAKHPINKPLYQMDIWTHFRHQLNLLKDTTMQSYLSTLRQDIDGYME